MEIFMDNEKNNEQNIRQDNEQNNEIAPIHTEMPEQSPVHEAASEPCAEREPERVVRLPHLRELLYLIPIVLSVIVTLLALDGSSEESSPYDLLLCCVMIAAMCVLLFVHFRLPRLCAAIPLLATPPLAMLILENMSHDPFSMASQIIWLNIAFFYIISAVVLCLTRRTSAAVFVCCAFSLICGLAEHYVVLFRSAPIFPWDLASIGIAATVADNYEFTVTSSLAVMITALLAIIYLGFYVSAEIGSLRRFTVRAAACVLSLLMLFGYGSYLGTDNAVSDFGLYPYLFTPLTLYYRNGFTVSFMMNLRYLSIEKPSGYSKNAVDLIGEEIDGMTNRTEPYSDVVKPNIIVVMNEAFSDLSVLCDFETNEDYMPYIRSLSENTVKGNLHMSVLGGNTANSEFEFLTGLSMAYLPTGSIPYQQYIKSDRPSLASQLSENGYSTLAVHPYGAAGWNRNTVYDFLGFDKMMFRSDLHGVTVIRNYVSDVSVFRYIISELGQKPSGVPMFTFNVTMQNHGAYTKNYDNFNDRAITAVGLENDQQLSQYLSLLKRTDDAVRTLIERLKTFDEPTMVVFFGDHQPGDWVSTRLLRQQGVTLDQSDINDREKYYTVPFFIWANYDIREEEIPAMSANYLSTLVCEIANIELTDAQKFLSEMRHSYPVITANSFMDADGVLHPLSELYGEQWLLKYAMLEYNYLFDNNTSGLFE